MKNLVICDDFYIKKDVDNYYLMYTNPLLGGNMKYDVILDFNNSHQAICKDFHITPISDRVPYNRYSDDDLLNWKHQDNIKDYYKEVRGDFYKSFVDPVFLSGYPLKNYDKCYDDTFLSGAKRLEYGLYGKQIQFFVPLWLDNIDPDQNHYIKFEITFNPGKDNKQIYHFEINLKDPKNTFDQYIKDYIEYIGIYNKEGLLNDIININLKERKGYIKGLEVSSGNIVTKDISDTVDFLLYRERPLIETNSAIIETFSKNNIIVPNIFNFNLCFNDPVDNTDFKPKQISVSVLDGSEIELNGKKYAKYLDKKCFFAEYDNLKKIKIINTDNDKVSQNEWITNIYSINTDRPLITQYLRDHECVDLVNKNKIPKNIIHWQTSYRFPYRTSDDIGYDIYPFNLYGGFPDVRVKPLISKNGENTVYPPKYDTVIFKRSLNSLEIEKPSKKAKEFKYIKNNNVLKYLYRVGGSLRPMFVWPKFDTFYTYYNKYKAGESKTEMDKIFDKYLPSKLPPMYPSLGYTPYISNSLIPENPKTDIEDWEMNTPKIQEDWVYKPNQHEFKWFNYSCLYNLPPELEFKEVKITGRSLIHNDIQDEKLKNGIYDKIYNEINADKTLTSEDFRYILSKYKINYDVKSLEKISYNNYYYNINIKLKLK